MITSKVPGMIYGGDYNPEQWPEEVWNEDVRLMREAGVNLVSLGIFSWTKLEPRPGEYDFGWLDRVVDLLYENGVMVNLATATASPPPWLARLHPESLPVTREGITLHALDLWKWAAVMDVVSVDLYPDPADPESYAKAAMSHDLMRSLGAGKPFVLMEQTTVRVNWRERNVPKRPGEMRLWSLGTVARGADGIMFFQWRQSRAGAEKFHSAMVPHVDPADSRSWQEVKGLGNDLARLDDLPGARGEAVEVRLPEPGRDLLTGKDHDSNLRLDPLGVAVLREASGQTARAR